MGYERKLTAGEAELLRRAGTYFGRERLLADHVLREANHYLRLLEE